MEVGRLMASMPHLSWLDLTGGEPFLRSDMHTIMEQVLAHTPRLAVLHYPTNGWFQDRVLACSRLIRRQRPHLALLVTVSLDGPPELHDRLRGKPGSFQRALDTFLRLREIPGVQVWIGTTVGDENRQHLPALRRVLQAEIPDFEDRMWHWNRVQRSAHFFANQHLPPTSDEADLAAVRAHLRRRGLPRGPIDLVEWAFLLNLRATLRGQPLGLTCQALRAAVYISADAWLYPCHVWDRPLVDLRQHDLDLRRAWALPALHQARREIEGGTCPGCFTPCEAYPTLIGSPLRAARLSLRRLRTGG